MASARGVIKCKAAVAWGPNQPLVVEEIMVDPPEACEVRIRIVATSLCHSDITVLETQQGLFPRLLGHEAAGVVESVGEGVQEVEVGDHVVPVFAGECGECKPCRSPKTNLCQKYWSLVKETGMLQPLHQKTRFSVAKEGIIHQIYPFFTSTFSEYTVVHVDCVAKISSKAPLDEVCLFGCGLPTGFGAVWNVAKVEQGSSVAIFGLGTIGLAVADAARMSGASKIFGIDINSNKFALGKEFGVTDFLNPNDYDKPIQQVLQELTNGGVDYAFECVGKTSLMIEAIKSTCEGWGKTVIAGVEARDSFLKFSPFLLFSRSVEGSIFGGFKGKTQVPHLVDRYLKKEIEVKKYITQRLPFEEINKGLDLLRDGVSLRCVMSMNHSSSMFTMKDIQVGDNHT